MMTDFRRIAGLTVSALVLAIGMGGQASAAATTLVCGYQQIDGSAQWETRYVYPATRQCPATSVSDGKQGERVYQEVLDW